MPTGQYLASGMNTYVLRTFICVLLNVLNVVVCLLSDR